MKTAIWTSVTPKLLTKVSHDPVVLEIWQDRPAPQIWIIRRIIKMVWLKALNLQSMVPSHCLKKPWGLFIIIRQIFTIICWCDSNNNNCSISFNYNKIYGTEWCTLTSQRRDWLIIGSQFKTATIITYGSLKDNLKIDIYWQI